MGEGVEEEEVSVEEVWWKGLMFDLRRSDGIVLIWLI